MDNENRIPANEVPSSAQLTAILAISAAFISAGLLISSNIRACDGLKASISQPQNASAAMAMDNARSKQPADREMHSKYRATVNKASQKIVFPEAAPRGNQKLVKR